MQTPELQHAEKQTEDDRTARTQKVLPLLPLPSSAQRDKVEKIWVGGTVSPLAGKKPWAKR
jgi:hypothetical protein